VGKKEGSMTLRDDIEGKLKQANEAGLKGFEIWSDDYTKDTLTLIRTQVEGLENSLVKVPIHQIVYAPQAVNNYAHDKVEDFRKAVLALLE
jgi:sugar phosphate isomerase/epimerase